jgi:hypothetical protein
MAVINSPFFGKFPKFDYDMNQGPVSVTESVTNIFFRLRYIRENLKNVNVYDMYEIDDGDTAEIIAEKVYGDSGAGWMILMANDILDAQFDWPLNYQEFNKYLIKKYYPQTPLYVDSITVNDGGTGYSNGIIIIEGGTGHKANAVAVVNATGTIQTAVIMSPGMNYTNGDIVTANVASLGGTNANLTVVLSTPSDSEVLAFTQSGVHHYNKIITYTDALTDTQDVYTYQINKKKVAPNDLGIPYQFYYPYTRDRLTADVTIKDHNTGELETIDDTTYTIDRVYQDANALVGIYIRNVINTNGNETIVEEITSSMVTYYEYETELNENKRMIKIIKPQYYAQMMSEFNQYTGSKKFLRRLV